MMQKRKNRKYQSVITKRIFQSAKKLSAVFLMVACATSLLAVRGTNAGFSDIEESKDNTWSAGSLDGRASYVERFSVTGMNPEQSSDSRITFRNDGSLDFRYGVKYRQTGGDVTLCDALVLTVKRNSNATPVYAGLLKDFDAKEFPVGSPFTLASLHADNWDFTVALPADAGSVLENKTCTWDFDFTAWQSELPDAVQGFSDVETTGSNSLATGEWLTPGDVVINEVMWMGSTASSADEWIELRNMTGEALPLGGWKLENVGSSHATITLPPTASIPAHGYYLIANYAKTSGSSALNVTPDYVVNLGLNNVSNGNIVLKNDATPAMVIDSALGTPNWAAGNHGALEQSMERNDIPGDGLLATSWHACVSGAANGAPYWDAAGNNFGTPLAANLSPIVLNEFVMNPVGDDGADRPAGEWIELYNILDEDIDVAHWYFTNADGDQVMVTADNTGSGETVVPGKGTLLVYLEQSFLGNDADTLSLYAPGVLPIDPSDDVREDTYAYEGAAVLPEGKSFARFPDGEGIWLDPEATPGKDNKMSEEEMKNFRLKTYDACFEGEELGKDNTEEICSPLFLTYLGLLKEVDDTKMNDSVELEILEIIRLEEEQKLVALLAEGGSTVSAEPTPIEPTPAGDGAGQIIDEPQDEAAETVVPPIEVLPPVSDPVPAPLTPETTPVEPVVEPPTPTEPTPTSEELPVPVPGDVSTEPPVIKAEPSVVETAPPAQGEETQTPAAQPEAPVAEEIPVQ